MQIRVAPANKVKKKREKKQRQVQEEWREDIVADIKDQEKERKKKWQQYDFIVYAFTVKLFFMMHAKILYAIKYLQFYVRTTCNNMQCIVLRKRQFSVKYCIKLFAESQYRKKGCSKTIKDKREVERGNM